MKYLISISYDGSKYNGLQKLKNETTVQGELESVLSKCNEKFVQVVSAGRTDKGVHALDQKCSFDLDKKITPFKLMGYLNRSTSKYLRVNECVSIEDENFHARFSVKSKTYKYVINIGPYDPIKADYVYNYGKPLDINLMKEASNLFLGPHNYHAFVTGKHKTYDSIIDLIEITEQEDNIIIKIKGAAFYTYMVRNIVASLILVGNKTIQNNDIKEMLETHKKCIEFSPAPASGLYLEKIEY